MRSAGPHTSDAPIGARGTAAGGAFARATLQALLVATLATGLLWLVWIYGSGLRDPRYLDGWILAGAMGVQLAFHVAVKKGSLSPRSAMRWRKTHIFIGYILIAAFISHSDFSLPDTAFEWALWAGFVLVTLSGVVGTYLTWSLRTKRRIDDGITYDRIPDRRAELAEELQATVAMSDPASLALGLPAPPDSAWIVDLYTNRLRDFFRGQRNSAQHLIGSERPLKELTAEIDSLSRYADPQGKDKLAAIKSLVIEKDRLDFAHVYLGLTRGWLFVHVPVTYALIVLSVLHIFVVYAYSSGAW